MTKSSEKSKTMLNGSIFILAIIIGVVYAFSGTTLKSEDYGDKWPFTVVEVELACTLQGDPYVISPEGGYYGLTGGARTHSHILSLDYIWDKPKSVGWVIDLAFEEVCN